MSTLHTLILKTDGAVPTLRDCETTQVALDSLWQENAYAFFCAEGHDFALVFADGLEIPYFFECPTCETVAFCCPVESGERATAREAANQVQSGALTAALR